MNELDLDNVGEPTPSRKEGPVAAVYMLVHLPTGLVYYGSSVDVYRRVGDHMKTLRANNHPVAKLQEEFNRGGEVVARVLQQTSDPETVTHLEQLYLDANVGKSHCLNTAINAEAAAAGLKRSEETKHLMREARKSIPLHENTRAALKRLSEERSRKVAIDGVIFDSLTAAGLHFNLHRDTVLARVLSEEVRYVDWRFASS